MKRKAQNLLIACILILAVYGLVPAARVNSEVEFTIPIDSSINQMFVSVQPAVPTYDGRKVDPVYARLAKETGGSIFVMDKGSTSALPMFAALDTESVMLINGKLAAGNSPVSFKLYDPTGKEMLDNKDSVESSNLNNGRLVSVKSPAVGSWKVKVSGSNDVAMKVTAKTALYILSAELVKFGGRPGHQGYFKKDDQTPYAGNKEMLEITISKGNSILPRNDENLSDLEFVFLGEDGKILQHLKSMKAEDSAGENFIGEVAIPNESYMVAMLGKDQNGLAFQRNFAPLFEPKK